MCPVIQQRGNDLTVLCGAGETARSAGVEGRFDFFFRRGVQGAAVEMAVAGEGEGAVFGGAGVHVGEVLFHGRGGEHVDIRDSEGFEDFLLEVIVQL